MDFKLLSFLLSLTMSLFSGLVIADDQTSDNEVIVIGGNVDLDGNIENKGNKIQVEYLGMNRNTKGEIESFSIKLRNLNEMESFDVFFLDDLRSGLAIEFRTLEGPLNDPSPTSQTSAHEIAPGDLVTLPPGNELDFTLNVSNYIDEEYDNVFKDYDSVLINISASFAYFKGDTPPDQMYSNRLGFIVSSYQLRDVEVTVKNSP